MQALTGTDWAHGMHGKDDELLLLWMAAHLIKRELALPTERRGSDDAGREGSHLVEVYQSLSRKPPLPSGSAPIFTDLTSLARLALDHFGAWDENASERAQTQRLINKFRIDQDSLAGAFAPPDTLEQRDEDRLLSEIAQKLKTSHI